MTSARIGLVVAVPAALSVAAWLALFLRSGARVGMAGYALLAGAVALSLVTLSVALVALRAPGRRRAAAFRVIAVWIGATAALATWELLAWAWPTRGLMDNPWYIVTGQGIQASQDLPFERPPHMTWRGLSRGDLAMMHGDRDPYAGVVTFQTDHQGFRNAADMSRADIVCLGDSFTEAGNVPEEQTFPRLLGQTLGRSVRNLGRAGYSPPTELTVLRRYALACEPKTVVWQLAESNDLTETALYQRWLEAGRPEYRITRQNDPTRAQGWRMRSPTYRLFAMIESPRPWPLSGEFRRSDGTAVDVRFLSWPEPKHSPVGHPGWPPLEQSLRQGAESAESAGARLVVLLIPDKIRVLGHYVDLRGQWRHTRPEQWEMPAQATLAGALRPVCARLGVTLVDATDALRAAAAEGELVYLAYDTHLSPAGHRVVADLLARAIQSAAPPTAPAPERSGVE